MTLDSFCVDIAAGGRCLLANFYLFWSWCPPTFFPAFCCCFLCSPFTFLFDACSSAERTPQHPLTIPAARVRFSGGGDASKISAEDSGVRNFTASAYNDCLSSAPTFLACFIDKMALGTMARRSTRQPPFSHRCKH